MPKESGNVIFKSESFSFLRSIWTDQAGPNRLAHALRAAERGLKLSTRATQSWIPNIHSKLGQAGEPGPEHMQAGIVGQEQIEKSIQFVRARNGLSELLKQGFEVFFHGLLAVEACLIIKQCFSCP